MGRPPRPDFHGALHHVTARSVADRPLFDSAWDRFKFLRLVGEACERFDWRCASYCLLGTHYHLLLETPEAKLADGMHWLNSCYAHWFNKPRGRRGHLFGDRYHTTLVTRGGH